ncbi:MAG: WD40 repeat domain-containing protein [Candidatus Solibacter usitatus]|nr:WD40 repeat domain-containing protein [Candidatus Solibacter usitatus]
MKLAMFFVVVSALAQPPTPVPVTAVAFHPGGRHLIQGAYEEALVWDLDSAKLARRIADGAMHGRVNAVALSTDGRTLAIAAGMPAKSTSVQLFDFDSGRQIATLYQSVEEIFSLAFSPDGKLLAAGSSDGMVRVWDVAAGTKPKETLRQHGGWVTGVAFSPDGKLFASASADRTAQVWDTRDWKALVRLPQPPTDVANAVAFSPDGQFLAIAIGGTTEHAVRLWRTQTLQEQKEVDTSRPKRRSAMAVTRALDTGGCIALGVAWSAQLKGGRILIPCAGNTVNVLGPNGGTVAALRGHSDWVYTVAVSKDGARIASGSGDGTVKLWSARDGALLATLFQRKPRTDEWAFVKPGAAK